MPDVDSVVSVLLQEYSARPVVPAVTAAAVVEVGEDVVVLGEVLSSGQLGRCFIGQREDSRVG